MASTPLKALIDERRRAHPQLAADAPWWGLALSGGGIRSATFALGLMRALARQGRLLRFDLLSTVSGGGYSGAAVARLFDRARSPGAAAQVERELGAVDERWFHWWLREGSRYLVPNGARDALEIAAIWLRNLLALHLELALLGLLLGLLLAGVNLAFWLAGVAPAVGRWAAWYSNLWWALPPLTAAALVLLAGFWSSAPTRRERRDGDRRRLRWVALLVALGLLLAAWPQLAPGLRERAAAQWRDAAPWIVLLVLLALSGAAGARWRLRRLLRRAGERVPGGHLVLELRQRLRQDLGRAMGLLLFAALAVLALGALDRAAWAFAFEDVAPLSWLGGAAAALGLGRAIWPRLAALLPQLPQLLQVSFHWAAHGLGLLALFGLAVLWTALAYRYVLRTDGAGAVEPGSLWMLASGLLLVAAYRLGSQRRRQVINLSSLHSFYRQRLTRAFLGAANPARFGDEAGAALAPVTARRAPRRMQDLHGDDDVSLADYAPQRGGGPVHLLNVCVNETQALRGGLSNPDRRGLLMSLAPGGLVQLGLSGWRRLAPTQMLSLGAALAVSGAAVAPGLGQHTRSGVAALLTLAGMRLGLWWNPGELLARRPRWHGRLRRRPRWQVAASASRSGLLLAELLGRFSTDKAPWFLSDGGHVENTGAYALLAQECRLVVVADAGADPDYRFADIERLVRLARIDLQVEIEFLKPAPGQLAPQIGALDEIASTDSQACIALARLHYTRSGREGLLVLIKPNVYQGLPVDLLNFKRAEPSFPQEATSDQLFSEAQWESYHQLGALLGEVLARELLQHEDPLAQLPALRPDQPRPAVAPAPGPRLPALRQPAVAASVGAGALATAGFSLWTLADVLRPPADVETVRTELSALLRPYGELGHRPEALPRLAALWLERAEQGCPGGIAESAFAQCMLADTLRLCAAEQPRSPACAQLLKPPLQGCLRPAAAGKPPRWQAYGRPAVPAAPAPCPAPVLTPSGKGSESLLRTNP